MSKIADETDNQTMVNKNNSIYNKLWAIQNEVKKIVRNEENKFQKYYFFNELQVLKILKPLLNKHQLIILLSDDENKEFTCEQVGNMYLVKYYPAKARGSAETYAVKYFLSKLFLIPVKNTNDPDYENYEAGVSQVDDQEKQDQQAAKEFLNKHVATALISDEKGGKVEKGESHVEALKREVEEETGLEVEE
ncbi:39947_t:CDS:2, partial [Gigaspora margarita]